MNKKDIKLIIGLLIVAVVAFFGFKWYKDSQGPDVIGVVQHGNEIILAFDLDVDDTYEFKGDYGTMHLEVKDRKFRVIDVECPNHICEGMGWIGEDDIIPISCLPNQILIYAQQQE